MHSFCDLAAASVSELTPQSSAILFGCDLPRRNCSELQANSESRQRVIQSVLAWVVFGGPRKAAEHGPRERNALQRRKRGPCACLPSAGLSTAPEQCLCDGGPAPGKETTNPWQQPQIAVTPPSPAATAAGLKRPALRLSPHPQLALRFTNHYPPLTNHCVPKGGHPIGLARM